MNSDLYFEGKKYISSSRAAKISGYVNDYIGQLCRDEKLDCRMIGRSWYVSFESLQNHKNSNYGGTKNKAPKIQKELVIVNPPLQASEVKIEPAVSFPAVIESSVALTISDPEVLPLFAFDLKNAISNPEVTVAICEVKAEIVPEAVSVVVSEEVAPDSVTTIVPEVITTPALITKEVVSPIVVHKTHHDVFGRKFGALVGMTLALFIAFVGFKMMLPAHSEVANSYSAASTAINHFFAASVVALTPHTEDSVLTRAGSSINTLAVNFYRSVNGVLFETRSKILALFKPPPEEKIEQVSPTELALSDKRQGLVVVPITDETDREATVAKIKSTFSDEVTVAPSSDGSNGVITPVFKKSTDDEYLYVLVPINN